MILAALGIVFSESFVISKLEHSCSGETCPICLQITIVRQVLKAAVAVIIALSSAFAIRKIHIAHFYCLFSLYPITPITLKVQINS